MHHAEEQGFTLVEVLVALVVSAMLLGVIYQGAMSGLTRLRQSAEQEEALVRGDYLLTRAAIGDFVPGLRSGRADALVWTVEEAARRIDPRGLLVLSQLHVTVRTTAGRICYDRSVMRVKAMPQ